MRKTATALLSRMDLILVQEPEDARRLAELGAPRVFTTGNLKFDVSPPPADSLALTALDASLQKRPVILPQVTHDGEEETASSRRIAGCGGKCPVW